MVITDEQVSCFLEIGRGIKKVGSIRPTDDKARIELWESNFGQTLCSIFIGETLCAEIVL